MKNKKSEMDDTNSKLLKDELRAEKENSVK